MRQIKLFLTYFLLVVLTIPVFAAEDEEEDNFYYLGEIYVISEKEFDNRDVLNSENLKTFNPLTLQDVIELSPGIDLSVGQKDSSEITLRGIRQDKIAILLDGIPIYDPYYNDTDLSMINLSSISRVTISKGYASAEYGANTLGGAINLITGKVPDKPKLNINLAYGNNNSIYSDILFMKRFNKLYLTFGINYGKSDGFSLSKQYDKQLNEDGNLRENSDFNKLGTLFRLGYDPKQNLNFSVSHYYINSNKGLPFDEQAEKTATNISGNHDIGDSVLI